MTPEELLKNIGEQISKTQKVLCPDCMKDKIVQPLHTVGDSENELFCPHCDLSIEIIIRWRSDET